jgi:hypothetical protein
MVAFWIHENKTKELLVFLWSFCVRQNCFSCQTLIIVIALGVLAKSRFGRRRRENPPLYYRRLALFFFQNTPQSEQRFGWGRTYALYHRMFSQFAYSRCFCVCDARV